MDTALHNMNSLFRQLGLPDSDADIERFISQHSPLAAGKLLPEAEFWNAGQAAFLAEAIEEDAAWAEIVDELDARLRARPSMH